MNDNDVRKHKVISVALISISTFIVNGLFLLNGMGLIWEKPIAPYMITLAVMLSLSNCRLIYKAVLK